MAKKIDLYADKEILGKVVFTYKNDSFKKEVISENDNFKEIIKEKSLKNIIKEYEEKFSSNKKVVDFCNGAGYNKHKVIFKSTKDYTIDIFILPYKIINKIDTKIYINIYRNVEKINKTKGGIK